jgi:hypothetical protein
VKLPPHFTTMKLPPHTPIWSNSTPQISYNCAVTISYNRKALNSSNSTPPISHRSTTYISSTNTATQTTVQPP